MEPFLHQDDHVLTFNWTRAKVGDVIVFKKAGDFFIKRIKRVLSQDIFVEGDNKKMSSKVQPIKADLIVGQVILKY